MGSVGNRHGKLSKELLGPLERSEKVPITLGSKSSIRGQAFSRQRGTLEETGSGEHGGNTKGAKRQHIRQLPCWNQDWGSKQHHL